MSLQTSLSRLQDSLREVFNRRTEQRLFRANLGRGDGTGTIIATSAPYPLSVNYYQTVQSGTTQGVAQLAHTLSGYYKNDSSFEQIEFWIGYPAGSSVLTVLCPTQLGVIATGPGVVVQQINTIQTQINNAGIVSFYAQATNPPSLLISIAGGDYVNPSTGALLNFVGGTIDLSSLVSSLTSGKHQLAWISLDCTAGTLQYATNTAKTATGALPSRSEWSQSDITGITVSTNWGKIIPVYLYFGQTSIVEADFYRVYDARNPLQALAPVGGGGGGSNNAAIYAMAKSWMGV